MSNPFDNSFGQEIAGTPVLGNLLAPINPTSVSFEAIYDDLVQFALNQTGGIAWKDWFDTDDGTIIGQWIAGLGAFRRMAELATQREASIDYAQLPSSIYENAFDRGLLIAPATAPQLLLQLTAPLDTTSVTYGQLVGMQGNYNLYSLENKTLATVDTLNVVVGTLETFTPTISVLAPFTMYDFTTTNAYIASQLELFTADTQPISLLSDPNTIAGVANTFILRRVLPSEVRLYIGNGTLGWYNPAVGTISYQCLTYGIDITTNLTFPPSLIINATLTPTNAQLPPFTITVLPSFDPNPEQVRAITRYYPLDGRIVQDGDYQAVILKFFGGILYDCYAYNSNPAENVYLLPQPGFGVSGSQTYTEYLDQISALVDSKRVLNIQVNYTVVSLTSGLSFAATLYVPAIQYSQTLQNQINTITASQLYQFARSATSLNIVNLAIQLSARFGIQFVPADPTVTLTLTPIDFLSSFTLTLVGQ